MTCKKFEHDLPDWLAGRLPHKQVPRMEAHAGFCPACARALAAEQTLRACWSQMPIPEPPADLWPCLAARLGTPAAPARLLRRARSGVLAAATLAGVTLLAAPRPASHTDCVRVATPPSVSRAGEQRVVRLIEEMQRLPYPDDPDPLIEPRPNQRALRLLISEDEEL